MTVLGTLAYFLRARTPWGLWVQINQDLDRASFRRRLAHCTYFPDGSTGIIFFFFLGLSLALAQSGVQSREMRSRLGFFF